MPFINFDSKVWILGQVGYAYVWGESLYYGVPSPSPNFHRYNRQNILIVWVKRVLLFINI